MSALVKKLRVIDALGVVGKVEPRTLLFILYIVVLTGAVVWAVRSTTELNRQHTLLLDFAQAQHTRTQDALAHQAYFDTATLLDVMAGYIEEVNPNDEQLIKQFRLQLTAALDAARKARNARTDTDRANDQ